MGQPFPSLEKINKAYNLAIATGNILELINRHLGPDENEYGKWLVTVWQKKSEEEAKVYDENESKLLSEHLIRKVQHKESL